MEAAIPSQLGRYEILDELGRGAMGVVYLAKDPIIGRLLALKTFKAAAAPEEEDFEEFRVRFIREAQSAGILSHPSIVTIHDVVELSEEGATFIAMEYVKGTNLKVLLKNEGHLDLATVALVLDQVAEGLDYAHSKGVIHRDIKPANIMLTPDQEVKITDFGIARVDTSDLTHDGQLLGTPNYMAPEQVQGQGVDHRADIFSLGVVLYEMITGEKPFFGESLTVVSHRIVYGDFTPPHEHLPGLPVPVVQMLTRALEKAPEKRFQRAGDLASAFREAAKGRSSQVVAPDIPSDGGDVLVMPDDLDEPLAPELAPTVAVPKQKARPVEEPSEYLSRADRPASAASVVALRSLALAVLAAVVVFLLYQIGLLLVRMGEPEVNRLSVAERQRGQYLPVLQEARRQMDMGRAREALELYDQALKEAPQNEQLRGLRDEAARVWSASQRRARQVQVQQARDEEIGGLLDEALEAMRRGRFQTAMEKGRQALRLDPNNAEVATLLQNVADAQREDLARRQQSTAPTRAAPQPVDTVKTSPTASWRPGTGRTALKVDFYTDISEGILTVYEGKYQILRKPFKFVEKSGLFRRKGISGSIEETLEVPTGEVSLSVYASYTGSDRTKLVTLKDVLKADNQKILVIRLSAEGYLTAELQ